ncbi:hypothetical protein [Xanthomonas arboricola]|nr:hypothetical protein [Xanthomonas arboricola]
MNRTDSIHQGYRKKVIRVLAGGSFNAEIAALPITSPRVRPAPAK